MKLNMLANNPGAKKNKKRFGRGIGSGKGKTCGRGVKGQNSRSGVAIKGFEGGQMPLIKRLAKRGFKCHTSKVYTVINLDYIDQLITLDKTLQGGVINKEFLVKANLIKNDQLLVKLVNGNNKLKNKIDLKFDSYSASAKENIEKAGGRVL